MVLFRRVLALVAALALSGCAGAGPALDRMAQGVEARSTCHTSTGEYVPSPGCIISYSAPTTVTSVTTTTTTTTTVAGPAPATRDD